MTSFNYTRRPRTAFAPLQPLPFKKTFVNRFICTANVTPPTESQSSSTTSEQLQVLPNQIQTPRGRVRLLHTRVITRVAEAGIRAGEAAVARTQVENSSTTIRRIDNDVSTLARLKKDIRGLHRLTSENDAEESAVQLISRLGTVVEALEGAVKKRAIEYRSTKKEQSKAENTTKVNNSKEKTSQPSLDNTESSSIENEDSKDFVEDVRKKVLEQSNSLRKRASEVGEGIEEKVAEFVRDDGSIDVDGLRTFIGRFLDNAGMTWKRLNGSPVPNRDDDRNEEAFEVSSKSLSVRNEDKEFRLREEIGTLEKKLSASSKEREAILRREDQLGKLIRAKEIRSMDDKVSTLRRTLAVRVLQLEMEKIFVSLAEEIENSDYEIMMEQRLVVVEFGDLDERLSTLQLFVDQDEPLLIEDDTVGELAADIQDLKIRLGLDEALYSSETLSLPQLRQFFTSSAKKTKDGVEFYSRGMRLFAGDMRFALRLIGRAIQGYSPTPREVRTIRRTGRDLLTLIPFTIVLIAPLTPVGHVLIFSFLQKYWPEFFPSTFSERRQAVMKRHEQYAKQLQTETENSNDIEASDNGLAERKRGLWEGIKWLLLLGFLRRSDEKPGTQGSEILENSNGNSEADSEDTEDKQLDEQTGGKVVLSDLAEGADREKLARRRRNAVALEELHLAD